MKKQEISKFFKDPIHREIIFNGEDSWLLDLLDTEEFQRLNRIKQLGLSYCIFPSATHTRFSHSLGVYEVTRKFIDNIQNVSLKDRKVILAAALLHDLGHGPNSHAFEVYTNCSHEEFTKKIIESPKTQINKILRKNDVDPKAVTSIFSKKTSSDWKHYLVSSQIDADRLDYLLRDSKFTNATYGLIDIDIISKNIQLLSNKIVFKSKVISAIENFLLGRYHMYSQVYENKHSLKKEWIIKNILLRIKKLHSSNYKFVDKFNLLFLIGPWLEEKEWELDLYLKLDDSSFEMLIKSLKYENDKILIKLINALDNDNYLIQEYDNKKICQLRKNNHFVDVIELKKIIIYDPKIQPIYINYNNKIVKLEDVSPIIRKLLQFNKSKKLMIIDNKTLN